MHDIRKRGSIGGVSTLLFASMGQTNRNVHTRGEIFMDDENRQIIDDDVQRESMIFFSSLFAQY